MKLIKKNVLSRFRKKFLLNALFLNFDIYLFFKTNIYRKKSIIISIIRDEKRNSQYYTTGNAIVH